MLDFNEFKKQKASFAENLQNITNEKSNNFGKDIWYPSTDSQGNAYAIVRFLPQKSVDKMPIEKIYKHKASNGKSLLCPSTFGTMKDCPLCQIALAEYNRQKSQGIERPKVESYRKDSNIINVLIIKDVNNPENEGQVKKYYLPRDIEYKIMDKLFPPKDKNGVALKPAEMICDLWEGRNFIIEVRKGKNKFNDYSFSTWADAKSPVAATEQEIENIYNKIFDLTPNNTCKVETIVEDFNNLCGLNLTSLDDNTPAKSPVFTEPKPSPAFTAKQIEKKEEENFSMASLVTKEEVETDEELPWD